MSTSDRTVLLEATAAAGLTGAALAVAAPGDLWMADNGLHPAWLPVLVLSGRYGTRGLFASLVATAAVLTAIGMIMGGTFGDAVSGLTARPRAGSDLLALAAATVLAWIAMAHETRRERLTEQLAEATATRDEAEATLRALHDSLGYLRRRHDRLEISLSMWRDLAARMERGDAGDAARAALELCEVRTGATAGRVRRDDGHRLVTVAARGVWPASSLDSDSVLARDGRASALDDRDELGNTDREVAIPVLDDRGNSVGVIALRGLPHELRSADLADLRVLASWLAPALNRPLHISGARKRISAGGTA